MNLEAVRAAEGSSAVYAWLSEVEWLAFGLNVRDGMSYIAHRVGQSLSLVQATSSILLRREVL